MFNQHHADLANKLRKNTLLETLNIHFYVKDGRLCASMPVHEETMQPMGLLHGGATAALAESLGSTASALIIDLDKMHPVGTSIHADHIKGVRSGDVHATATLMHKGRKLHLWDIKVHDDKQQLIASCRLTNMLIPAR